jgi:phytoene dehydrogenase-like protein
VAAFQKDMAKVVSFLRDGYRNAEPPTLAAARRKLGKKLTGLWITGSARALLDHYFTSEAVKLFYSVSATESGPVPLDSPYSAFSIPLMASGSIFDGGWGFVKGGIWSVAEELAEINKKLGVETICSAAVVEANPETRIVTWKKAGKAYSRKADALIFATDPLSAARLIADKKLTRTVSRQKMLGTSGKLVLFFKKPVRWKNPSGQKDFDTALRFISAVPSMKALEKSFSRIKSGKADYAPGYYEIYCEGAADRKMGGKRPYELVSVFFKNLSLNKNGKALAKVRREVAQIILGKIENPQDMFKSILLTPKDLQDIFYFPQGNIDHIELCENQTFCDRSYSKDRAGSFYQFGRHSRVFYCGAGAYPAGSIAGTPGYMCAQQILRLKP